MNENGGICGASKKIVNKLVYAVDILSIPLVSQVSHYPVLLFSVTQNKIGYEHFMV